MARLIPKINPDEIENNGERQLAKSLISQLAGNVEVYHSFRWLAETDRGTLQEGECDFVVLDPTARPELAGQDLSSPEALCSSLVFLGDERIVKETWVRGRRL